MCSALMCSGISRHKRGLRQLGNKLVFRQRVSFARPSVCVHCREILATSHIATMARFWNGAHAT